MPQRQVGYPARNPAAIADVSVAEAAEEIGFFPLNNGRIVDHKSEHAEHGCRQHARRGADADDADNSPLIKSNLSMRAAAYWATFRHSDLYGVCLKRSQEFINGLIKLNT